MISEKIERVFEKTVDIVFGIILVFIMFGIAIGAIQLFWSVWELLKFEGITGHYIDLIADVLTLYVLIELSRTITDYFREHKLRLALIVDAAIIFIIREVLIGLFKHEIEPQMLYAFSAFILVLGLLRMGAVALYQQEKKIVNEGK